MDGNPQLENGYIKIANEIWLALASTRIPGIERQILDVIIHKTYGWNKKQDVISLSQFTQITGIKKQNVHRAIKSLKKKNIIKVINIDDRRCITYQFNKYYKTWKMVIKSDDVIKGDDRRSSKVITQRSSKVINTKDSIKTIKNNKTKLRLNKYLIFICGSLWSIFS